MSEKMWLCHCDKKLGKLDSPECVICMVKKRPGEKYSTPYYKNAGDIEGIGEEQGGEHEFLKSRECTRCGALLCAPELDAANAKIERLTAERDDARLLAAAQLAYRGARPPEVERMVSIDALTSDEAVEAARRSYWKDTGNMPRAIRAAIATALEWEKQK